MKITVLVTLMVFLAYFLVLYGVVGFIQDKRFFLIRTKGKSGRNPRYKGTISRRT